jgi:hypothetical protein
VTRAPSLRILLAASAAALALALPAAPPAPAASSCHNLTVTQTIRTHLRRAHRKLTNRPFKGPQHGSARYGRCGKTYYGLAYFKEGQFGYQDQPEVFTRTPGKAWRDRGDTGGEPCGSEVPNAMLHVWGFNC